MSLLSGLLFLLHSICKSSRNGWRGERYPLLRRSFPQIYVYTGYTGSLSGGIQVHFWWEFVVGLSSICLINEFSDKLLRKKNRAKTSLCCIFKSVNSFLFPLIQNELFFVQGFVSSLPPPMTFCLSLSLSLPFLFLTFDGLLIFSSASFFSSMSTWNGKKRGIEENEKWVSFVEEKATR